jgi:hypothetical protein
MSRLSVHLNPRAGIDNLSTDFADEANGRLQSMFLFLSAIPPHREGDNCRGKLVTLVFLAKQSQDQMDIACLPVSPNRRVIMEMRSLDTVVLRSVHMDDPRLNPPVNHQELVEHVIHESRQTVDG